MVGHRQGGDGRPGVRGAAGVPRRRRRRRTTSACSRFPATDVAADNWIPAASWSASAVSAKSKNGRAGEEVHRVLGQPENVNRWAEAIAAIPLYSDGDAKVDPVLHVVPAVPKDNRPSRSWTSAGRTPRCSRPTSPSSRSCSAARPRSTARCEKMDEAYRKCRMTSTRRRTVRRDAVQAAARGSRHHAAVAVRRSRPGRLRAGGALPEHRRARVRRSPTGQGIGDVASFVGLDELPARCSHDDQALGRVAQHAAADRRDRRRAERRSGCCSRSACTPASRAGWCCG